MVCMDWTLHFQCMMYEESSMLQRTSTELESVWRMQVIRENNSKRDVWKRYGNE